MSKPLVCTLPGHGPDGVCTCCLGCIALRAELAEAVGREMALREALDRVARIACKGMCKTTAYAGGSRTLHECGEIMRVHSRALLSAPPAPEPGKGGA